MIDVTTQGPDGHWDYEDIKRLCEYRDRLRAGLQRVCNISMAITDDPLWARIEMYDAAREALGSQVPQEAPREG